jgi:hypothetical protein
MHPDPWLKAAFSRRIRDGRLGRTIMTFDDKEKEGGMRQPGDESGISQPSGTGMNQPGGGMNQPGGGMNQPGGGMNQPGGGMNQPSGGTGQPGGMGQDKKEDKGTTG